LNLQYGSMILCRENWKTYNHFNQGKKGQGPEPDPAAEVLGNLRALPILRDLWRGCSVFFRYRFRAEFLFWYPNRWSEPSFPSYWDWSSWPCVIGTRVNPIRARRTWLGWGDTRCGDVLPPGVWVFALFITHRLPTLWKREAVLRLFPGSVFILQVDTTLFLYLYHLWSNGLVQCIAVSNSWGSEVVLWTSEQIPDPVVSARLTTVGLRNWFLLIQ